jgi:hypothetical protein
MENFPKLERLDVGIFYLKKKATAHRWTQKLKRKSNNAWTAKAFNKEVRN